MAGAAEQDFAGLYTVLLGAATLILAILALGYRSLHRQALEEHANMVELIDNLSEGVYRSTLDGRQLNANRALVRLNGYAEEDEMLASVNDIAREWYVDPRRRDEFRALLDRDGRVEDFVSEIYRHKTRERIWISESARIVRDGSSGKPLYYEGSVREISETVARLKLEEMVRKLTSHLPGALFQFRTEPGSKIVVVEYLSIGFEGITEMRLEDCYASNSLLTRLVHPDDADSYMAGFRRSGERATLLDHEFRIVTPSGKEKWLRMTAQREPDPERGQATWYGYISDISSRKRQALEIEKLAFYDPLTSLPNRRLLASRIAEALGRCRRQDRTAIMLFIDLDNFKSLNDTQGHDVGDAYLGEIARRLEGCLRETDTVARMGGDEFVVVAETATADQAVASEMAVALARKVMAAIRLPFDHGEIRHKSSASIGALVFDGDATGTDELLKRADIAMYRAKGSGRDAIALFEPEWMDGEEERFTILSELRQALAEKTLELHFQPQVNRDGTVSGAEGLLRWNHPKLGYVPPDKFIPLAEQSGLISQVCDHVIDVAVRQLATWSLDPATEHLSLAVNVSVKSFAAGQCVETLTKLLASHRVDPSRLTLEFTEHVTAPDQEGIGRKMAELKALGVRFSLDDFGTGYSSLSRLKLLKFDELKIDGSFVADVDKSEEDRALVRTILAIATTLDLIVVAEHVETETQRSFLHAFGCDVFQGYLFGPAMPPERFRAYVAERNGEPVEQAARLHA